MVFCHLVGLVSPHARFALEACGENLEAMVSHLSMVRTKSTSMAKIYKWTTRQELMVIVADEESVETTFRTKRGQGFWRKHPDAPTVKQLEQVWWLASDGGESKDEDVKSANIQIDDAEGEVAAFFEGPQGHALTI